MSYDNSMQQRQGVNLEQRLSQRMMMSPQMQQALQFLQLPVMELSQLIDQELEINPLLELLEEDFDGLAEPATSRTPEKGHGALAESLLQYTPTLRDVLNAQLKDLCEEEVEKELGLFIIDNFDENGFLTTSLEELSTLSGRGIALVERVLKKIQWMDPAGVGARSIQESLLLQLERKQLEHSLAYELIRDHYDDLLHHRIVKLKTALQKGVGEIEEAIKKDIAVLELHPGLNFAHNTTQGIVPDVIVHFDNGEFRVEVLDEFTHRIHLNSRYMKLFDDPSIPLETKNFIKEKLQSAKWLMKNIAQRNSTLQHIAEELIKLNHDYFIDPDGKLKPLTMKQLADTLELHESTITRAVANKYISCDRGVLLLKSFFTSGFETSRGEYISSTTIRDKLKKLIGEEDPKSPLSDMQLSQLLQKQGISCARRTVAKYREAMHIGSTSQRRQYT